MHTHQSLFDSKKQRNAFYDEEDAYHLSPVARQFIAGLLRHVKEICAIIAPTVNSYKRLTPGYEAPVYVCWARQNRSALVRIPRTFKGKAEATRCELRCPDPSCNPYLAFAAMVRAGLKGIEEGLVLGDPSEEDVFEFDDAKLIEKHIEKLPASLREALSHYYKSPLVKEILGEHVCKEYYKAKYEEWDQFRIAVTDWELDRYLSVL